MPVSQESMEAAERVSVVCSNAPLVVRCQCGLVWNVVMERSASGLPGCVPCSCGSELVAWSGTVSFSAALVEIRN